MSIKRDLMPEENARLLKIYREHPELTVHEVIEKYASAEWKQLSREIDEETAKLKEEGCMV